jgi:hypothetical protein
VLQTPHPYQRSYQPLIGEFTELTGINVNADLVPEADYFTNRPVAPVSTTGSCSGVLHLTVRTGRLDRRPQPVAGELLDHRS